MTKNKAEDLIDYVSFAFEPLEYMALQIDNAMDYGEAGVEQPMSGLVCMTLVSIKNEIKGSIDKADK